MAPAIFDTLTVQIQAGDYVFRATGSNIKFPGFMVLYTENTDQPEETEEKEGSCLSLRKAKS